MVSDHPMSKSRSSNIPGATSPRRPGLTKQTSLTRLTRTISVESTFSMASIENATSNLTPGKLTNRSLDDLTESLTKLGIAGNLTSILSQEIHRQDLSAASGNNQGTSTSSDKEKDRDSLEVPFINISLDASLPHDYFKDDVLNTIQALHIKHWYVKNVPNQSISPLDRKKIDLTRITGAMTNVIYKVEYPELPSLLLRVYGPNGDSIIDREYELQVLARLSSRNIGPKLFGCFENGRFEQYLENSTTLTKEDIRDWKTSQRIARRMKELHSGVPLLPREKLQGATVWRMIEKWFNTIESNKTWIQSNKVQDVLLAQDWENFKKAIQSYRYWLQKNNSKIFGENLVFCHNDTQYGNLLFSSPVTKSISTAISSPFLEPVKSSGSISSPYLTHVNSATSSVTSLFQPNVNISLDDIILPTKDEQKQDSKLVVIDFEYAGPNPAVFDLANHLCEWMHDYNCNEPHKCFIENFPNRNQILNFLYSYVSHLRHDKGISIDEEVRQYYNALMKWRGTVQLFWGLWAIIQSGNLSTEENNETTNDHGNEEITVEEHGPGGAKYIIKTEEYNDEEHNEPTPPIEEVETAGVDIDSFDYLGFCKDKMSVFWGDLISLGVVNDGYIEDSIRKLGCELV
ncbi:hypothetical protein TBLA_0A04000 [Henningerozyma blattae CBS 6284]|uniref:Choline kinase N-terminal domain-containing protein n=1 Tax=Henningerozyma blattae (strain ATCC 34711 / CBS 6284 / DSM 70876 / NBRC 10599 / NRRL Y-10934 / UCD 77-7) TaxID=1071380 RepID=I2GVP4_HENB6|nr:hypothetical protein TBLA_0A04000 [Tetrapisispora blattae CBS 6284]CCH58196.1 hypothetical protein TBLA_0A04000 [Tetrapisispora blattae CBS 6284]